jgi:hypothetical protein
MRNLTTLSAAFLTSVTLIASLLLLPGTLGGAAPLDKRKPGLYWTFYIVVLIANKYAVVDGCC